MTSTTWKTGAIFGLVTVVAVYAVPASALTSGPTWQSQSFSPKIDIFVAQFDAVANMADIDGVVALSASPAGSYSDCAVLVRFNSSGTIDARDGGTYTADSSIAYVPGTSYHFLLVVNTTTGMYSVFVTPKGSARQPLAVGYAFRSEQAGATRLANLAAISEVGSFTLSNFTVTGASADGTTSTTSWQNSSFATQNGAAMAQFDATPNTANMDGVVGLSSAPGSSYSSFAAMVRFNSNGTIDARDGSAYAATANIAYTPGTSYHFRLAINVPAGIYSAYVTPKGGTEQTLAVNCTFRTEQAGASSLANCGIISDAGSFTFSNLTVNGSSSTPGETSTSSWANTAFAAQKSGMSAEFDATPNAADMDGVVGLSTTAGSNYGSFAAMVRFNGSGTIDARNGGAYAADTNINYTAGTSYHFRIVANVPAGTYSVYVTPKGGSEQTLATNYAFRTEQAGTTSLANYGIISESGTFTLDNFTVKAQALPLIVSAGASQMITAGQSCTLAGSASGGTSPYTYSWSPTTGLSSATSARPTASPKTTTTYTLTVKDAAGASASAKATVTVNAVSSGPTYYVSTSGNDNNAGTASAPWRTLSKAASSAGAGTTVIVQSGTYGETLTPRVSGSTNSPVTFKSATPQGAKITRGVDLSSADYVRIQDFDISNSTSDTPGVRIQSFYTASIRRGQQIVGNYIHGSVGPNFGHGIDMYGVQDTLIENNEITGNGNDGIHFSGTYSKTNIINITIRGNYIHLNGQDGIHPEGQQILIENNRIGDQWRTPNHDDGLEVYGPIDGLIIRNNLIWDTTQNVYISAEVSYIRNVQILGNVIWNTNVTGDGHKGLMICPSSAGDITNLRVEGNTLAYNAINLITDAYAASSNYYISGFTFRNNIFYASSPTISIHNSANIANNVVYTSSGGFDLSYNGSWYSSPSQLSSQGWLSFDLRFVNAGARDFHLQSGSPCIDRGVTISGLTSDPDGNPRPMGSAFDIGAYEKQ